MHVLSARVQNWPRRLGGGKGRRHHIEVQVAQ